VGGKREKEYEPGGRHLAPYAAIVADDASARESGGEGVICPVEESPCTGMGTMTGPG